jgi:uncharacterized protein (TIGR00369 family)
MKKKLTKKSAEILKMVRARLKESAATVLLGFEVESFGDGEAVLFLDVKPHHRQIHGVVHGGILAALVDTAAALAAYSVLPQGAEIATVQLSINYLAPVPDGRVKAAGKVLRVGRNFVVTECEVLNTDGAVAAKALLTFGAAAGHSIQKKQ